MDLEALDIFASVAKAASYTAVARDRDADPSSISRIIATLERELGVRLFQRTTRQITLTEAGAVFLNRIAPLMEEFRQAQLEVADTSSQPKGLLRVSAANSFGLTCIVPTLPAFQLRYPDLTVDLQLSDHVVDLLAERMDVAIRLGVLPDSSLMAHRLLATRYVVCAAPGYLQKAGAPQAPGDVGQHACIVFPLQGFRTRWIFRNAKSKTTEVSVTGTTILSNGIAVQHCARAGMGIALLPTWLVAQDLASGKLIDLFPSYEVTATEFDTAAWCVYPSRSYVPTKVKAFVEHLMQALNVPP